MLNPTNPSRLKSFDARLAAEAERCAGQTLTAAMEYEVAEAHRVRARQVAAAKRAECKQRLNTKRSRQKASWLSTESASSDAFCMSSCLLKLY